LFAASPHRKNIEPLSGVAVSVTDVPIINVSLHIPGQLMPTGLLATDPPAIPCRLTDSLAMGSALKVAVTT